MIDISVYVCAGVLYIGKIPYFVSGYTNSRPKCLKNNYIVLCFNTVVSDVYYANVLCQPCAFIFTNTVKASQRLIVLMPEE